MNNNMSLHYIFEEKLAPWRFAFIIRPQLAAHMLQMLPASSVMSMLSGHNSLRSRIGGNPYQSSKDPRSIAAQELERGSLVAINESCRAWSPVSELFFINTEGRLQAFFSNVPVMYPSSLLIRRYEEMVQDFGTRPPATIIPPTQIARPGPEMWGAEAVEDIVSESQDEVIYPLTKAERWQDRKNLISSGRRSLYPDAQTAANRLAKNNIAVEKAKLAQNVYGVKGETINALESMPNVPEGWNDISNDKDALASLGLNRSMLFDETIAPDFFARVYAPDTAVFGNEMNPTVVFRGTRPEKLVDWGNNLHQGIGMQSDYYENAVSIGKAVKRSPQAVDISGHSLGGGLASAAGIASGRSTWTFNSAGLADGTVEKYGGQLVGDGSAISAYRVDGEVLTKLQEVSLNDLVDANFDLTRFAMKASLSNLMPNAVGNTTTLSGGVGNMMDRHEMTQVIDCIEAQKDEDIGIIKNRL